MDQWPPVGFFENAVYILLVGENQKSHRLIKDSLDKPVWTSGYSPVIFEGVKHRVNMGLNHRSIIYCLLSRANYLSNRLIFCKMGKWFNSYSYRIENQVMSTRHLAFPYPRIFYYQVGHFLCLLNGCICFSPYSVALI